MNISKDSGKNITRDIDNEPKTSSLQWILVISGFK